MRDYISSVAKKLLKKHKTRNPFHLAEQMNIQVRFYNFTNLKGFYTYCFRNRYIGINQNINRKMQILCCTHEIGHDQLHRHSLDLMKDYDLFSNLKTENEANLLAAHILVPDNILEKYHEYGFTIEQIAQKEKLYPDLIRLKFLDDKSFK